MFNPYSRYENAIVELLKKSDCVMKYWTLVKSNLNEIMLCFDYVFVQIVELNFFENKNMII